MRKHIRFLPTSMILVSLFLLASCSSAPPAPEAADEAQPGQVPAEVSLASDRSQFEELRKDVPADVRRQNDELALVLELMRKPGDPSADEEPAKVRERFNKALRDKRAKIDKELRKEREDFGKNEKRQRDEFLAKGKSDRERFSAGRPKPEERKRFFEKQDGERKAFFADQQDKRREFESKVSERRKTFEDYVRERTNQFNQEWREYNKQYAERKKALELKKTMEDKERKLRDGGAAPGGGEGRAKGSRQELEEFSEVRNIKPTPLAPSDQ